MTADFDDDPGDPPDPPDPVDPPDPPDPTDPADPDDDPGDPDEPSPGDPTTLSGQPLHPDTDPDLAGAMPGDAFGPFGESLTIEVHTTVDLGEQAPGYQGSINDSGGDKNLPDNDDSTGGRDDWSPTRPDFNGPNFEERQPKIDNMVPPEAVAPYSPLWSPFTGTVDQMRCWSSPANGIRCGDPARNAGGGDDLSFDAKKFAAEKAGDWLEGKVIEVLFPYQLSQLGSKPAKSLGIAGGFIIGEAVEPAGGGWVGARWGAWVGELAHDLVLDKLSPELAPPELDMIDPKNPPPLFRDMRTPR